MCIYSGFRLTFLSDMYVCLSTHCENEFDVLSNILFGTNSEYWWVHLLLLNQSIVCFLDIDEWSFHKEIVFSAIFTMMILSSQLFIGMKNYRKHAKQLKEDNYKDIPPASELEPDSQASESVRYLGFVFLNVVGGFFIWFHIVLFIVTICSLFSFHAFTFEIYRLELILSLTAFIGPVLVLYGLKSSITRWICIFTTSSQSEDTSTMLNNKVYANLVYLTLIFSKSNGRVEQIIWHFCIVRLSYCHFFFRFSSDQGDLT